MSGQKLTPENRMPLPAPPYLPLLGSPLKPVSQPVVANGGHALDDKYFQEPRSFREGPCCCPGH